MLELDIFQGCLPLPSVSVAPLFETEALASHPSPISHLWLQGCPGSGKRALLSSPVLKEQNVTWIVPLRKNCPHPRGNTGLLPTQAVPFNCTSSWCCQETKALGPDNFSYYCSNGGGILLACRIPGRPNSFPTNFCAGRGLQLTGNRTFTK